jgi:hypothetical protein
MPFCRIVRDSRGYEYLSLVQQTSGRRGKTRQQILYWYRTPPNIKVGRQALDEAVMRELEARHPGVQFDWDALRDTPPLLPAVEPWRERRRAERAARQFRDADEDTDPLPVSPPPVASPAVETVEPVDEEPRVESLTADVAPAPLAPDRLANPESTPAAGPTPARRRRHRRRGRRPTGDAPRNPAGSADPAHDPPGSPAHDPAGSAVQTGEAPTSSTDDENAGPDDD